MSAIELLATRSYKNYRSRLAASNRLQNRQRAWNACLLALSVAMTVASIGLLSDGDMYGRAGPTVLVCVSVGALAASLVAAGLNYGARSRDMFMNYRALQKLAVDVESSIGRSLEDEDEISRLTARHDALLDDSENHTAADYKSALPDAPISQWVLWGSRTITGIPYIALFIPFLIIWPFAAWAINGGR